MQHIALLSQSGTGGEHGFDHRQQPRSISQQRQYPRIGNDDCATAARMEAAARSEGQHRPGLPDDPPEFARSLEALQRPALSASEREEIYDAIEDFFAEGRSSGSSTIDDM